MELITGFPPRPIANEAELIATQERINSILDKSELSQDDRDYLKVLGTLVYDYEQQHEPMPRLKRSELLKALLEESNLQVRDLILILEVSEPMVLEILNGDRQLNAAQIDKIADFFRISPASFF